MLKNYLKIAFRNLWKQKLFSGINILGMAAAIACSLLLFLTAFHEFSYDRFHKNGSQIYRVYQEEYRTSGLQISSNMPAPMQPAIMEEIPELAGAARWLGGGASVEHNGEIHRVGIRFTDPSFFDMFSFPLTEGDPKQVLSDLNGAVITEKVANRLFGKTDVLGESIKLVLNGVPKSLVVRHARMRTFSWILITLVCFVSGGATCMPRGASSPFPPPPPVLNETPSLEDVTTAVNRTSAISQLSTISASVDVLSMPNLPKLSGTLHLQREKEFRLQANLPIVLGSGLDMGSNNQMFWFEVPEGMTKTLYYASHDKYRQQLHRAILPVDPTWLMDALGLIQLDPSAVVAGPVVRPDGKLEIRSRISMPDGLYERVCFIANPGGYVTDQLLYAPSGALIASSQAENHQFYEQYQCVLPHLVTINLTPAGGPPLSMKIDVGTYAVNQLLTGDPNIFAMPQTASKQIDLTTLSGVGPEAPQVVAPVGYTADRLPPIPYRGAPK